MAHGVDSALWSYDPDWIVTKQMTPQNNKIDVLSNTAERQENIDNPNHWIAGWLYMEFRISNIFVPGLGELNVVTEPARKIFRENDNDHTIVIQVLVPDA